MRILGMFSLSCATAIFLANYVLPESAWCLAAGLVALLGVVSFFFGGRHPKGRKISVLLCAGAAVGLLWTSIYTAVWFQPARGLDDKTVCLNATVVDWPQETTYGWSVLVRAETDTFVRLTTLLYVDEQGKDLRPGDHISTVAHCALGDRTFSGTEITYYTAKGIFLRGVAYGRLDVQRPDHVPLRYWPVLYSRALKQGIDGAFPEQAAPFVRALVTGNRDHLTDEFTTSLERTGLSHMVVVSGMHLAFLSGVISFLLGKGKRSTAVISVLWVLLFCGIAGNTPSVLRAAIMILMLQLAPLLGRERDMPTALGFALMLLLLWNPFSAAHLGLQLSFAAVAGIFLVSDRMEPWLLERLHLNGWPKNRILRQVMRIPRFFVQILCASLGASLLIVPLTALHFQRISLISPLSNLLTMWAVAILFVGGFLTGTVGMFSVSTARILAGVFTPLVSYLQFIIDRLAKFPLASVSVDSFYYQLWVLFFCLLILVWVTGKSRVRPWIPGAALAVALAAAVFFTSAVFRGGELTAVVLDVGQGQSVLLRTGNYLSLIDCGGDKPDNAGDIAADYIQSIGRDSLDLLVVSHFHSDHANGIPQLLRRVEVDAIALPEEDGDSPLYQEVLRLAQEKEIEVWTIREDTTLYLGEDQEFTIFAPLGQGTDTNELGLSVLATAGDFDVLLTGDMSGEVERLLLEHTALPNVELLVVGHHGSRYSTTEELLSAVRPDVAVISVGENNQYGHPTRETLDRLELIGAEIYRTDQQGTVTVRARDWENEET